MSTNTITVVITYDVDRGSSAYSSLAVEKLDPKRSSLSEGNLKTLKEADQEITTEIAWLALVHLLTRNLPKDRFGETTIRIKSPKNVSQIQEET